MKDTQERRITENEVTEVLKGLLKRNIVGVTRKQGENELVFMLPGGKSFRIYVREI